MGVNRDARSSGQNGDPIGSPIGTMGIALILLTTGFVALAASTSAASTAPPEVHAPNNFRASPGQLFVGYAFDVNDNAVVDWDVKIIKRVDTKADADGEVEVGDATGKIVRENNDRVGWQFEFPAESHGSAIQVMWKATDGEGKVDKAFTWIRINENPDHQPQMPEETSTGFRTIKPIADHPVAFSLEAAYSTSDTEIQNVIFIKNFLGDGVKVMGSDNPEEGLYVSEGTFSFGQTGIHSIGHSIAEADGGKVVLVQDINVMENSAPKVDAEGSTSGEDEVTRTLTGYATDAPARPGDVLTYEWYLVDSPILGANEDERLIAKGQYPEVTFDTVGTHVIELRVTDPYGAVGTDQVTIEVDDAVSMTAALTNADGQTQDGTYEFDLTSPNLLSRITGEAVLEHDDAPAVNVKVHGTVVYYGLSVNGQGIQTQSFTVTTDDQGVATFSFDKELLGATGRGESIASAPGYHEIHLEASADSVSDAPTKNVEIARTVIPYTVGPVS